MELLSEYGVTVMSNREFDGRFARKSVIGSGTFGRVWKAFDEDVKQEVAIKKIDNFSSEHLGVSMLVIREVSFLRQLDHPNITKVREIILNRRCWQNSNALKLVMDLASMDLAKFISTQRDKLSLTIIAPIARQVLEGLDYLHSNLIMHRDLKPNNILIDKNTLIPKITDFGCARTFTLAEAGKRSYSWPIQNCYYAAPEVLLGSREYTSAIDMWSYGCILMEMMRNSNELIFEGEVDESKVAKAKKQKVTSNDTKNHKKAPQLKNKKAAAKDESTDSESEVEGESEEAHEHKAKKAFSDKYSKETGVLYKIFKLFGVPSPAYARYLTTLKLASEYLSRITITSSTGNEKGTALVQQLASSEVVAKVPCLAPFSTVDAYANAARAKLAPGAGAAGAGVAGKETSEQEIQFVTANAATGAPVKRKRHLDLDPPARLPTVAAAATTLPLHELKSNTINMPHTVTKHGREPLRPSTTPPSTLVLRDRIVAEMNPRLADTEAALLLVSILCIDPTRRIKAKDALAHRFFSVDRN